MSNFSAGGLAVHTIPSGTISRRKDGKQYQRQDDGSWLLYTPPKEVQAPEGSSKVKAKSKGVWGAVKRVLGQTERINIDELRSMLGESCCSACADREVEENAENAETPRKLKKRRSSKR